MARIKNMGGQWLVGLAAIVIILAGLKSSSTVVTPILLGLFISIILSPPLMFLTKKGLPSNLVIILLILLLITIFLLFVVFVSSSIDSFLRQLPVYQIN